MKPTVPRASRRALAACTASATTKKYGREVARASVSIVEDKGVFLDVPQ